MRESGKPDRVDALLDEAERQPFVGWDFSWLRGRLDSQPLPWDYTATVIEHARSSPDLLDLGTGGGEWLAELPYRPPRTVATEARGPNVAIAGARLGPVGGGVVQGAAAPDHTRKPPKDKASAPLVQVIRDVGALAWGLKAIPWMVPGFSIDKYRARLREIQARIDRDGAITVRQRRFWVRAQKPR